MTDRIPLDDMTSDQLDALYDDRDRANESARLALEQRQEMAAERYAWQERGDRAEARLAHLQTTSEAAGRLLTRTTDERDQLRDAVDRVRAVVHVADDEDVTDWQRGFRACSVAALRALDEPAPAPDTTTPPALRGPNWKAQP